MRLIMFRGRWKLRRRIEHHVPQATASFSGQASFEGSPMVLDYREEGTLHQGGARYRATRRYLWRAIAEDLIEVRFADGRFFHSFASGSPEPEAQHPCGPDLYEVRYDFRRWPVWTATWRVRGPSKNYLLHSTYCPDEAGIDTKNGAADLSAAPHLGL